MNEKEKRNRRMVGLLAFLPIFLWIIFDYFNPDDATLDGINFIGLIVLFLPFTAIVAFVGLFIKNTKIALIYYLTINLLAILYFLSLRFIH